MGPLGSVSPQKNTHIYRPLPFPPPRHQAHKTEKKSHIISRYARKNTQRGPTQKGRPRRGARASLEPPREGGRVRRPWQRAAAEP